MKILMEIDEEIFKLKNIIHELNVKNIKLHKQLYSLYVEADSQQSKIEALESSNEDLSSENNSSESIKLSDENEMSNENTYAALKKEILTLQLEVKSKAGIIAMLELELHTKLLFYEKFKILNNCLLVVYKKKTSELEAEIERLRTTLFVKLGIHEEDEIINEKSTKDN